MSLLFKLISLLYFYWFEIKNVYLKNSVTSRFKNHYVFFISMLTSVYFWNLKKEEWIKKEFT